MSYTAYADILFKLTPTRPFADAVKAGVGSIMCSYNQVNNSYACQNSYTINHILKGELDFQGFGKFRNGLLLLDLFNDDQ